MSQFDTGNLSDLDTSPYLSKIATTKPMSADPVRAMMRDVEDRITQANDALQALASRDAGAGAPKNPKAGQIWHDTSGD